MQSGIKDMKVLPINAHLFTLLHLADPPLSSIKAQSAHGATSLEEVTRVRARWRGKQRARRRRREQQLSEGLAHLDGFDL